MENFLKKYRVVLLIALVLIVVPLMIAGFYNRPSADDLTQPMSARQALLDGGNLFSVLQAAFRSAWSSYLHWNGVFICMIMCSITPMIGSTHLAWIHPIIFILFLPFSLSVLLRTLRRIFHFSKTTSVCCTLLFSCFFLLLIPNISEGIYWYSGAVSYTFMFCFSLALYAGALSWAFPARPTKKHSLLLVLLCMGFFLLGGTNFTTSTVSVVLLGYMTVYIWFRRKERRAILLPFLCLLAGYAVAILAPGNSLRAASQGSVPYNLPEAFFYTFRDTFIFLFRDMRFFAYLLFFVPVAVAVAEQINYMFPHPIFVLILSFLVVAAGFMPPEYSERFVGPYRLLNIQFF